MRERLKKIRKALGLRQREVAERLGCSVGIIGTWEAGIQPIPKVRVYQICNEYGVNREWFETGRGDMFKNPPKPQDQALQEAALALFNELSPEAQTAVLAALRERIEAERQGKATGSPPPLSVKNLTIENSHVDGDVIQE